MGNYANRCSKLICKGDMAGYRICVTRRWKQRMRWNVEMASEARALACLPASISSRSRVSWPSCVRCILLHYPQSTEASRIWKVFIEVKEILPSGKVWFIRSPSTIESCKPRENLLLPFEGSKYVETWCRFGLLEWNIFPRSSICWLVELCWWEWRRQIECSTNLCEDFTDLLGPPPGWKHLI